MLSDLLPDLLASFFETLCRPRSERPALHLPSYLLCAPGVPHGPHGLFVSVYLPPLTSMDAPGWQRFYLFWSRLYPSTQNSALFTNIYWTIPLQTS